MKKNLAKKVTLSILAGAMLMSSSVVWANNNVTLGDLETTVATGDGSLVVGKYSSVYGDNSIAIGIGAGSGTYTQVGASDLVADNAIAIGSNAKVTGGNSVAIGVGSKAIGSYNVALGYGSLVGNDVSTPVVSVGYGGESGKSTNGVPNTRSIINVTDVSETDRIDTDSDGNYKYGSYAVNVNTLNDALSGYCTKEEVETLVGNNVSGDVVKTETSGSDKKTKIGSLAVKEDSNGFVTLGTENSAQVKFESDKVIFGENSSWYQEEEGFFAGGTNHNTSDAKAALKEDGEVFAGKFTIKDVNGNKTDIKEIFATKATTLAGYGIDNAYTKREVDAELAKKASQSDLDAEKSAREQADQNLQTQIDNISGGSSDSIAGINQRLDKTNAKINKVGAGAAALAALHPLEYDPDDKLTFSAGMGNYAGENAAALGAFYRPNEKFMLSLGGTMGNGENMVNLGLSIGLDKPNGYAKLSKRELIQEVNAVKAENNMLVKKVDAVEAENEAMKAEMAEMKAMLQAILAKK